MADDRGLSFGNKLSETTTTEFTNNRAYVIGINAYQNGIPQLRTAVADAERLGKLLKESHGYDVLTLPRNGAPTLATLRELIHKKMLQEVGPNDRVLFYFAGHGIALDGDDGPEGYLVPEDANREDRTSFLSMVELNEAISKLPCRHFLLILDCCFAGAFRWSSTRDLSPLPSVIHKERYERYIQDPAWQVLTSAAYDQKALDVLSGSTIGQRVETETHSPFAEALFRALEGDADLIPRGKNGQPSGDGVITATELYLYLRESVETATIECKMRQTPGLWPLKKHDKGEYILLSPGHELNLPPAPELNYANNPYRGLQSFDEAHCRLFFGREREIEKLHKLVSSQTLTVVLGASGTGKSSLVKAGLLPCLRSSAAENWCVLPAIRVGSSPLATLASLLLPNEVPANNCGTLLDDFRTNENAFANRVKKWEEANPDTSHLLLTVDQFEELITLCTDANERDLFIAQIANAISLSPNRFRLILTLRTDFEPQFSDCTLKTHWMNGRYIVPPMSTDDLRQAIEGPASTRVLYLKPSGLIDLLVDEVIQTPGALPLLSFTMSELYVLYIERQGDDRCLTLADYEELGGVAGSLRSRASKLYDGLDSESQMTLKRLMLRMVSADGGNAARRRVPKSELEYASKDENVRVATVLKLLSDARLVVEGKESDDAPYVEPAHDELIRGWDKLLKWMRDEQEELLLRSLLTPAANDWLTNPKATWHANPRLLLLRRVAASKDNWLNAKENDFVKRSVNKKRWNLIILSTLASTAIAIIAIFGLLNWQNANRVFVSYLLLKSQQIYSEDPLVGMGLALEAQAYDVDNSKVRPTDENLWAMASNYLLTKRTGVDNVVEVPGCSYCIIDFESQPAELRDKLSGALISQLQGRLNPDYSQQTSCSVYFDDKSSPSRFIAPYDDRRADLYSVSPPRRLVSFGEDIDLIEYNSKVIFVAGAEAREIYLFRDGSRVELTKKTKDVTVELTYSSEYFVVKYDSSVVSMFPSTELRSAADGAVIWSFEGNPKIVYPHCKGSQFLVDYGDSKIEVRELGSGGVIVPKEQINSYTIVSKSLCVVRGTDGKSELRSIFDGRTVCEDVKSANIPELNAGIDGREQFVAVNYSSGKMELLRTNDYSHFCPLSGEVRDIEVDKIRKILVINYYDNSVSDAFRLSDGARVTNDTVTHDDQLHQTVDSASLHENETRNNAYIEKADEASGNSTFFFPASSKSPVDLGPSVHNYAFNAVGTHFIISYKRGFNELSARPSELRSGIDGSLLKEFPAEVLGGGLYFNDNASEESFCWDPSGQYFCLKPEKMLTRTGSCQLRCLPNAEEVFPGNGIYEILLNPKNPLISDFALVKRSHEKSELWCLTPTPHKLTEFGNKPEFLDFSSNGRLWIKERGELTLIDTEWAMATPFATSQMGVSDLRKLLLSFPLSPKRFDSTRLDPLMQGYKRKICK